MSDRAIDINTTNSTSTRIYQEPTPEEVKEYRAKMLGIYDRGLVLDRLHVDLSDHPDVYGEWAPRDQIDEYRIKGFEFGENFVPKSLNDRGDGRASTLDVVFMVKPMWKHVEDEKIRAKRYYDAHIRDRRKQKEEIDFEAQNTEIGMPVESKKGNLIQSSTEVVTGSQITAALQTK